MTATINQSIDWAAWNLCYSILSFLFFLCQIIWKSGLFWKTLAAGMELVWKIKNYLGFSNLLLSLFRLKTWTISWYFLLVDISHAITTYLKFSRVWKTTLFLPKSVLLLGLVSLVYTTWILKSFKHYLLQETRMKETDKDIENIFTFSSGGLVTPVKNLIEQTHQKRHLWPKFSFSFWVTGDS